MLKTILKDLGSRACLRIGNMRLTELVVETGEPIVVYYHRVHDEINPLNRIPSLSIDMRQFEAQIAFFRNKLNPVSLGDVIRHWRKDVELKPGSIAVTFDDGFRDNYSFAFPVLKKYDVPATFFITTGFVGQKDLLWWDKTFFLLDCLAKYDLLGELALRISPELYFHSLKYCQKRSYRSMTEFLDALKRWGTQKISEFLLSMDSLLNEHSVTYDLPREFLSWEEISEMMQGGMTIGSHTCSHKILSGLNDADLRYEVTQSKRTIEERTGTEVDFFAYPDGMLDGKARDMVKDAGYLAAFQTRRSTGFSFSDHYSLGRFPVKENHSRGIGGAFSESMFEMELAGFHGRLSPMRRSAEPNNPS